MECRAYTQIGPQRRKQLADGLKGILVSSRFGPRGSLRHWSLPWSPQVAAANRGLPLSDPFAIISGSINLKNKPYPFRDPLPSPSRSRPGVKSDPNRGGIPRVWTRKMQSLGLKLIPGFTLTTSRSRDARRRRDASIVVCCSSSDAPLAEGSSGGASANSFLSRGQTYALLKQQLAVAAKFENYKEAARIRDTLKTFEEEEPVLRLRGLMRKAIQEENFRDAAKYRDELMLIAPYSLLKCSSDATTLGIRVQVRSVYIEGRSQPLKGQYFFAYRIRISNNSDRPVQLLRRHWIITDANGRTENFWGTGVVGEQPVILPGTGFEYSSACPLSTPNGRMEGDFEMKHIDRVGSTTFNVAIAPFSLSIIGDDDGSIMPR